MQALFKSFEFACFINFGSFPWIIRQKRTFLTSDNFFSVRISDQIEKKPSLKQEFQSFLHFIVVGRCYFKPKYERFCLKLKKGEWSLKQDLFGNFYNFFSIFKKLRRKLLRMLHDSRRLDGLSTSFFNIYPSALPQIPSALTQTTSIFESHLASVESRTFLRQSLIQNELFFQISRNSFFIDELSSVNFELFQRIDHLDQIVTQFSLELKSISENGYLLPIKDKNVSLQKNENQDQQRKKGRIHYKTIFREKIFGVKQYKYRLHVEGKIPQVLFKERNICLKISLLDSNGQKVANYNAISLNLKVYYSNGEEVGPTAKGQNFIKGTINSIMLNGKASFDKLYPREVSRKLDKRKLVLTIYPSRIGSQNDRKVGQINPEQIEPMIIYGIKVITKQTKDFLPKQKFSQFSEYSNESYD